MVFVSSTIYIKGTMLNVNVSCHIFAVIAGYLFLHVHSKSLQ